MYKSITSLERQDDTVYSLVQAVADYYMMIMRLRQIVQAIATAVQPQPYT
jgi:hypothetical protein